MRGDHYIELHFATAFTVPNGDKSWTALVVALTLFGPVVNYIHRQAFPNLDFLPSTLYSSLLSTFYALCDLWFGLWAL